MPNTVNLVKNPRPGEVIGPEQGDLLLLFYTKGMVLNCLESIVVAIELD